MDVYSTLLIRRLYPGGVFRDFQSMDIKLVNHMF